MSATAAKATRRQLRRSVGDTALGAIIEQGSALAHIDTRVTAASGEIARIDAVIVGQGSILIEQRIALAALQHTDRLVRSLTFYQRLRWLFTGIIHGLS